MVAVLIQDSISLQYPKCKMKYTRFYDPEHVACKGRNKLQDGVCKSMNYKKEFMIHQIGMLEDQTLFQESNLHHRCFDNVTKHGLKKHLDINANELHKSSTVCIVRPTLVLTKINWEKFRGVDDQKRTITLDISTTKYWTDRRLKTYNLITDYGQDGKNIYRQDMGQVGLSPADAEKIWTPDVHVYNTSDYDSFMRSIEIVSLKVFKNDVAYKGLCLFGPIIEYTVESKVTFYCNLDYTFYPMDMSICQLRFGSTRSDLGFMLFNNRSFDRRYRSINFEIEISTIQAMARNSSVSSVGLDIKLRRLMQPFVLKYYLPCCMITCLSQCSFIIPLTALPGRVALTVTQLLTLTSIFIQQMVRRFSIFYQ